MLNSLILFLVSSEGGMNTVYDVEITERLPPFKMNTGQSLPSTIVSFAITISDIVIWTVFRNDYLHPTLFVLQLLSTQSIQRRHLTSIFLSSLLFARKSQCLRLRHLCFVQQVPTLGWTSDGRMDF